MARILLVTIVAASVLYIVGGFVASTLGWFQLPNFQQYAAILGGVASVLGLLGLIVPRLSQRDIQKLDLAAIERIRRAAEDIESYEKNLIKTREEFDDLQVRRANMELLVKKISLQFYLKQQMLYKQQSVLSLIKRNEEIYSLLCDIADHREQMTNLRFEMDRQEDIDFVLNVIEEARETRDPIVDLLRILPGFSGAVMRSMYDLLIRSTVFR